MKVASVLRGTSQVTELCMLAKIICFSHSAGRSHFLIYICPLYLLWIVLILIHIISSEGGSCKKRFTEKVANIAGIRHFWGWSGAGFG